MKTTTPSGRNQMFLLDLHHYRSFLVIVNGIHAMQLEAQMMSVKKKVMFVSYCEF